MKSPAARREFARLIAAAVRAGQTAHAKALGANKADAQRLTALAYEIVEREARLDPDDLGAIQLLAAKRDQISRLEIKFTADSAARLADADKQLRCALDFDKLAGLFRAEHAALLERVGDSLQPFVRTRVRALRLAHETDSASEVGRLLYLAANLLPLDPVELLAALDGIAGGKPPWVFD